MKKLLMVAMFVAGSSALAAETVVFTQPNGPSVDRRFRTGRPEQCMPFGAGNLSAMVAFGTDSLELHLSRADYILGSWKDRKLGQLNGADLPSVGHVTLKFPGLKLTGFRQVMDVERGEVRLSLPSEEGKIEVVCSGDRESGALVVEMNDPSPVVTYSCGRVGKEAYDSTLEGDGRTWAELSEVDHKSNRHYETRVELKGNRLVIASATAPTGDGAKSKTKTTVAAVMSVKTADLEARRLAWWKDFWSKSHIELEGDWRAPRMAKIWKINLYAWANVGYGEIPPKFNGGPGLVFGDSRAWGAAFWWQNTRELIWPMMAANHPEFAKGSLLMYDTSLARIKEAFGKDETFAGFQGAYMPETVTLDTHPLTDSKCTARRPDRTRPYVALTSAQRAECRERRRKADATYTSHVYSSGAEYVQELVEYVRWTGDRTMVPKIADWTREQGEFYLGILEKGADCKWHTRVTNVNESWWQVDDSLVDLCGARFVFAMAVAHGREWGYPAEFIAAAKDRLDNLALVPTVDSFRIQPISPTNDYAMIVRDVVPGNRRFVPTPLRDGLVKHAYAPNEIYIVYPFNMCEADRPGPGRDRAISSYRQLCEESDFTGGDNSYLGYWGWDHLPVAAVRLNLPNAFEEVWKHIERTFRWPFGGAKSPAGPMYEGALVEDAPYFDGSGVMATALQEMLLQSQAEEPDANLFGGGVIKFLPCVPRTWSGSYKLIARGGFVVECSFRYSKVVSATITATRDTPLRYLDPFTNKIVTESLAVGERVEVKIER